ncbi:MAG UNVERIFIED_CONTAM: hypothetical protein LVR18_05745 [Planctomycetaceae bacterium]
MEWRDGEGFKETSDGGGRMLATKSDTAGEPDVGMACCGRMKTTIKLIKVVTGKFGKQFEKKRCGIEISGVFAKQVFECAAGCCGVAVQNIGSSEAQSGVWIGGNEFLGFEQKGAVRRRVSAGR